MASALAGFVRKNRFVFRAVVLEQTADVRQEGKCVEVDEQQRNAHGARGSVEEQRVLRVVGTAADHEGRDAIRKQLEEAEGQGEGNDQRPRGEGFRA